MLHALLGGEPIGLLNDASSLLVTDRKKNPTLLHIIIYVTENGFIPCHSLLYNTKGKFYNSCTNETEHENNFHIERALAQKWSISFNSEDFSSLTMTPTLFSLNVFYCIKGKMIEDGRRE